MTEGRVTIPFRGGPLHGQSYDLTDTADLRFITVPVLGLGQYRYAIERVRGFPVAAVNTGGPRV